MAAVGLVPDLTAKAAEQAVLGAGARVVGCYSYELTHDDVRAIANANADMILLAGGTDGGNRRTLLGNARILAEHALEIPVVIAGNRCAAPEAEAVLSQSYETHLTENVMPEIGVLNVEPAREQIRRIFMETIVYARGFEKVERWVDRLIMPTPAAVLQAGMVWSEMAGDHIIVDLGGATTDVHSFCSGRPQSEGVVYRGLPEPYAKRTVEGDLGLRVSAQALTEHVGLDVLAEEANLTKEYLSRRLAEIHQKPAALSTTGEEIRLDRAMAVHACREALRRHAGWLEETYTPSGRLWLQRGKDLTDICTVVFTGGYFAHGEGKRQDMQGLFPSQPALELLPRDPDIVFDSGHILAAAGLFSERDRRGAARFLKRQLAGTST